MRFGRAATVRLLVLGLGVGCAQVDEEPRTQPEAADDTPDQIAHDVSQVVTRDGRKRAEIVASRLLKYEGQRRSDLEGGVTVRFYSGNGRLVSTLESRRAVIDEGERVFTAVDSVVLVSQDGTVLHTDTLRWEEGTEKVFGPGRVTIDRKEGREEGVGFVAESDLSTWTLTEVVTTLVPADSAR